MKLQKIPVNMQQSVIWTQQPEVSNTICAITHQHRDVIVVMAGFQGILPEITECAGIENPTILYGDSFNVDTWDYRVKKFLKECYLKEELKRVISNTKRFWRMRTSRHWSILSLPLYRSGSHKAFPFARQYGLCQDRNLGLLFNLYTWL
jgi:hypothetical protein